MKSFAKIALIISAYLMMMNVASAAFILSFNPTSATVGIGGSGSFNVLAQYQNFDGGTNALSSFNIALTQNNADFTLSTASLTGTQTGFANAEVRSLGTVNFTHVGPGLTTVVNFGATSALNSPLIVNTGGLTLTAVPEPSSIALVGLCAVIGVVVHRRRRRV